MEYGPGNFFWARSLPQLVAEVWGDVQERWWGEELGQELFTISLEAFQYFNHKYCWLSLWYAVLQEYITMRPDLTCIV